MHFNVFYLENEVELSVIAHGEIIYGERKRSWIVYGSLNLEFGFSDASSLDYDIMWNQEIWEWIPSD